MSIWLEKYKLSKPLAKVITELGFIRPREIQAKTLSRLVGGQDFIAVGPEGSGKTTTYLLGILTRLKQGTADAPRALVLVPDKEKVLEVIEQFALLNRNKTFRIAGAFPGGAIEPQMDEILDGADIVVATPDRARAIYLKLGLNLNKVLMFVVDDAHLIVKQGLQLPVVELANSIRKCQHLVFTEVLHEKLQKMIAPFMREPALIEVEDLSDEPLETIPQLLYQVPNFRTKVNLLQLLLEDTEVFTKALVFVNTRATAEKLYQNLIASLKREAAVLQAVNFETKGFETLSDFSRDASTRILIAANEAEPEGDLQNIPFLIHFELPDEKEIYIRRVTTIAEGGEESLAIAFSTDIELAQVRKIEQVLGKKLEVAELPESLITAKEPVPANEKAPKVKQEEVRGDAFHPKKASNAKDYNFGAGLKAKMTKKRKH